MSARLLRDVVLPALAPDGRLPAEPLEDAAAVAVATGVVRFTSDAFVVSPRWFPGGDLGALAAHGTINDLAVTAAEPVALAAALIVEEGFDVDELRRLLESLGAAARSAGVPVVTGDTKVVDRGAADGLYITTSGVGTPMPGASVHAAGARPGDLVILSGPIAAHGMAVLSSREGLGFDADLRSDSQPLHHLVRAMVGAAGPRLHAMRDPTRGGLASALGELAAAAALAVAIDEAAVPVSAPAAAACEILGLDPFHVANEGCLVAMVDPAAADDTLAAMRGRPEGRDAVVIGEVRPGPAGRVSARTPIGGERIVDMLLGEQLPRIC